MELEESADDSPVDLATGDDFADAILDTVGALIVVLDPDGRIERFNRACERLTGRSASSVVGRRLLDVLVPEEERAGVEGVMADLLRGSESSSYENDWIAADGERHTISWTNTVLRRGDEVTLVIGTGIDVTQTRRLQQRLSQSERLDAVGRLAAGIAHDVNNTLAALRLRLDRLERRLDDPDAAEDIDAAHATIDHTQDVIADLVSFSRRQALHPQAVEVNGEVRRVSTLLADLLGDEVVTDLRLADREVVAHVDPGRFELVLTNLLINARDAMVDGGTVTITTGVDRLDGDVPVGAGLVPGDYVRVAVADTGTGIEPHDLPHIFDPYFTTKGPGQGTGLGLATTHGTIAQTGGAIEVESVHGDGAVFTIWLPRHPPTPSP